MKIGIIGAAEMGGLLARKLVMLGHQVTIANSRGAASLAVFALEIGAESASVKEAIKNKDLIIISIPLKNIPDLPKDAFATIGDDVTVIDTCNYYPTLRDGHIAALQENGIDSFWVQQVLGVRITKVFNSILATSLSAFGKPKADKERIAIAVSGDHLKSKKIAAEIVNDLGFDSLDVGGIMQSWKQQPGSDIYCRDLPLHELKRRANAMGDNWQLMRNNIETKRALDEKLMEADYGAYLKTLN